MSTALDKGGVGASPDLLSFTSPPRPDDDCEPAALAADSDNGSDDAGCAPSATTTDPPGPEADDGAARPPAHPEAKKKTKKKRRKRRRKARKSGAASGPAIRAIRFLSSTGGFAEGVTTPRDDEVDVQASRATSLTLHNDTPL